MLSAREVYTLTVVAEDSRLGESKVILKESVGGDGKIKIGEVLEEFKEHLDGLDSRLVYILEVLCLLNWKLM